MFGELHWSFALSAATSMCVGLPFVNVFACLRISMVPADYVALVIQPGGN
jgi:hypothetical protein